MTEILVLLACIKVKMCWNVVWPVRKTRDSLLHVRE